MTRRERLENKIEKRREWAEKAATRSNAAHRTVSGILEHIPLGQPILVGHHSERRHRRDIARVDAAMGRAVEESKKAESHTFKAAGLERQLETSIYSDDPDALEALQSRIETLEAQRTRMKAANAAFRKSPAAFAAFMGISAEAEASLRTKIMEGYSWCRQPHPAYELQNLGANINRLKKRVEEVQIRQRNAAAAEEDGGCTIAERNGWTLVVFSEKPDRSILNDLKAAGFRWSKGSWYGLSEKVPASVRELTGKDL